MSGKRKAKKPVEVVFKGRRQVLQNMAKTNDAMEHKKLLYDALYPHRLKRVDET